MQLGDVATALQPQLFGSREELDSSGIFVEQPALLNRVLSKLAYCVRDAQPRYVTTHLRTVIDESSFTIVVYTDDHLIHLAYEPRADHITTSIVSRRSIRRIELLSAPNFLAGESPGTYEGKVAVEVRYENLTVHLPGDNHASDANREQLDAFIVSLLRDLAH